MLAEPGALIGFAGPRVIEQTIGERLPEGFQRSEFQLEHGFVDKVVPRSELRATLIQLLQRLFDLFPRAATTHIHTQRHPFQLVIARLGKGRDAGQKCRRDVVNAEITDIFQRIHSYRLSCTGKSADDQQFHGSDPAPF